MALIVQSTISICITHRWHLIKSSRIEINLILIRTFMQIISISTGCVTEDNFDVCDFHTLSSNSHWLTTTHSRQIPHNTFVLSVRWHLGPHNTAGMRPICVLKMFAEFGTASKAAQKYTHPHSPQSSTLCTYRTTHKHTERSPTCEMICERHSHFRIDAMTYAPSNWAQEVFFSSVIAVSFPAVMQRGDAIAGITEWTVFFTALCCRLCPPVQNHLNKKTHSQKSGIFSLMIYIVTTYNHALVTPLKYSYHHYN